MTINRVLLHFNSATKQENRFLRIFRWHEEANAVSEHIDSLTEGLLSF